MFNKIVHLFLVIFFSPVHSGLVIRSNILCCGCYKFNSKLRTFVSPFVGILEVDTMNLIKQNELISGVRRGFPGTNRRIVLVYASKKIEKKKLRSRQAAWETWLHNTETATPCFAIARNASLIPTLVFYHP